LQNERVVFGQRERVGGEIVELRLAKANRRLHLTGRSLLTQNVGHVIGPIRARRVGPLDGGGDGFRAVVADQFEQLTDLPG
jgi:hypothetical protein